MNFNFVFHGLTGLFLVGAVALTGCPNKITPAKGGGPNAKDDPAVVEWLEKIEAETTKKDDHIVAIDFSLKDFENEKLKQLAGLPQLATLTFVGPETNDETLKSLAEVTSLVNLRLDETQVGDEGIEAIKELPKLEELRLDKTAVTDTGFEVIANMPEMKRVFCSRTKISDDGLAHFKGNEKLEALDLTQCIGVSNIGISHLADCKKLKYLKMYGRDVITDEAMVSISKLTNMTVLGVEDTSVSDEGLKQMKRFDYLEEFYAFRCINITNEGVAALEDLTNLRRIRLRATSINGGCVKYLSNLPLLEILDVSETYVGDDGMAEMKRIDSLKRLNMWHTEITNEGLADLGEMTQLTWLNLDDNMAIDDAGVEKLAGLENLEFLHLGKTSITDDSVETIKKFTNLKTLDLTNCFSVSPDAVDEIKEAIPDVKIIGP